MNKQKCCFKTTFRNIQMAKQLYDTITGNKYWSPLDFTNFMSLPNAQKLYDAIVTKNELDAASVLTAMSVNTVDATSLYKAIMTNDEASFVALFDRIKIVDDYKALRDAIYHGNDESVVSILNKRTINIADANESIGGRHGRTVFHVACYRTQWRRDPDYTQRHLKMLKALLDYGFDINAVQKEHHKEETALDQLVHSEGCNCGCIATNPEVVTWLIANGAKHTN